MPIRVPQIQPSHGGRQPAGRRVSRSDPLRGARHVRHAGARRRPRGRREGGVQGRARRTPILKNEEMKLDVARAGNERQRQVALDVDKLEGRSHWPPDPTSTRSPRSSAAPRGRRQVARSFPNRRRASRRRRSVRHGGRDQRAPDARSAGTGSSWPAPTRPCRRIRQDARAARRTRAARRQTAAAGGFRPWRTSGSSAARRPRALARFNTDIERGEILRDVRDPVKRPVVIDTLVSGGYEHSRPTISSPWRGRSRTKERRQRQFNADAERVQKKEYDGVISELYVRANEGDLTVPQLNQLARPTGSRARIRPRSAARSSAIARIKNGRARRRSSTPSRRTCTRSARRRPRPSSIACTRRTAPAARA